MTNIADRAGLTFLEAFVFAHDIAERQAALGQLSPMSEEYYYFALLSEQLANPTTESGEEKRLKEAMTKQFG
jgi:hypothetical protein